MWIHPFEIITIGGDDFIIVVPAKHALDIAATIAHELEKRLVGPTDHTSPPKQERYNPLTPLESDVWTETQRPVISLSAGVVIAHDHTPISYVSELAGQLQKSAKRARKAQHYPGGTVDFAALKSSGAVSLPWESYRRQAFNTDGRIHLTARPFTWHELRGLLDTVRGFKEAHFPRSQMYRLQQDLLKKNRLTASLNYLYYLSHLDNEARKVILKHFQCPWHNDMTDVPPWRKVSRTEFETIWADLLEIYDFVEAQREAG
jgi:CRISPR-associated protein Cmr2